MESMNRWALAEGKAQNVAADYLLARLARHHPRDIQRWARTVSPAATALLAFAYEDLRRIRPASRARILGQVKELLAYRSPVGGRWPQVQNLALSERALRRAQGELRTALARLVLRHREGTLPGAGYWRLPRSGIVKRFYRVADWMQWSMGVMPRYMEVVFAAADVLSEAVPWIRFCQLCGRAFFKVKGQRYCTTRCKAVLHARVKGEKKKKGGGGGRPRVDYAAEVVTIHTAWLHGATRGFVAEAKGRRGPI